MTSHIGVHFKGKMFYSVDGRRRSAAQMMINNIYRPCISGIEEARQCQRLP